MKRTDYSEIAAKYDDNEVRRRIPEDEVLAARLRRVARRPFTVLDLACGTGNWLAVQTAAFAPEDIRWHALDASEAMLGVARRKVTGVEICHGRAEHLPYDAGAFDFVATSFAFHHFEEKSRALDEIRRVLRPGGALRMRNIVPSFMPDWWVYRFFPEAAREDEKRFWSPALLLHELSERGFEPDVRVDYHLSNVKWGEIRADAERREISSLVIVREPHYQAGLARIREAMARDPEGGATSEVALLDCTAVLARHDPLDPGWARG
jgi:SAM-dependent methyltransferase